MLKGIIADLDGTLINSRPAHEGSLNDALERKGFSKLKEWIFGPTTEDLVHYNFPEIPQDMIKKIAEIKKASLKNYLNTIKPLIGAEELMDFLKSKGIKICLLTNNTHEEIDNLLPHLGWENRFDAIVGKEDGKPKPDPEPVIIALEKMGLEKKDVVFIGDSNPDLEAGHGAGVKVMISQAVHSTARADEADFVVKTLKEAKEKFAEMIQI